MFEELRNLAKAPTWGLCTPYSHLSYEREFIERVVPGWEHFSGSISYPIPSTCPSITNRQCYDQVDEYKGVTLTSDELEEYLELRLALAKFIIEEYDNENS